MSDTSSLRRLAGFAASALFLGVALAGVDVETGPKASVQGTIAPPGEFETLRFEAPADASLSFTLSATKTGANELAAALEGPMGGGVDLGAAKKFTVAPRKVVCQSLALPETGAYALRVSAAGVGAYKLVMTATPAKSVRGAFAVDPGKSARLGFAAVAGARVTVTAKASHGSPAVPRFGSFGRIDLTGLGKTTPKSHAVKGLAVARTGDVELEVRNTGAAAGGIDVTVAIQSPAAKTRKLDVRGVDGAGTSVERTISSETGGEIVVTGAPGPLTGCIVSVPPGALAQDTPISVATAPTPVLADPATQQPAGPAVAIGPAGTSFSAPVSIRLPFDPDVFPRGSDPATALRVVRRESDGTTTTIVPTAVLTAQGLCDFETTGFSTFVPVAPKGPPSVVNRSYWSWRLASVYENSQTDSRGREFRLRAAVADFGPAGSVALTGEERVVAIDTTGSVASQVAGHVTPRTDAVSTSVAWQYTGLADPAVTVGGDALAAGEDGAVLCGAVNGGFDVAPDVHLFLERPAFPPTSVDVQGLWWIGRIAIEPVAVAGAPAKVTFRRTLATLDLRTNGTARITGDESVAWYDSASSQQVLQSAPRNESGTFSIAGPSAGAYEGAVEVVTGASSWRLLPARGGQILAGTDTTFANGVVSLVLAVRKSSGRVVDDIDATYSQYGIDISSDVSYAIDGVPVGDWSTVTRRETRWHGGSRYFDYTPHETRSIVRSESGDITAMGFLSVRVDMGECEVTPDGLFSIVSYDATPGHQSGILAGLRGGIAPDLSFGFGVPDPSDAYLPFGLRFFVRFAPHQSSP